SRRRHTIFSRDWSSDVCSSDLPFSFADEELRWWQLLFRLRCASDRQAAMLGLLRFAVLALVWFVGIRLALVIIYRFVPVPVTARSEERRVGKRCNWRRWT